MDVAGALADRMEREAQVAHQANLARIQGMVDSAESLEQLRDDLLTGFGELEMGELQRVMAAGFALAELYGMADVSDESENASQVAN